MSNCLITKTRIEVDKAKANYFKQQALKYRKDNNKFWFELKQIEPETKVEINNIKDEVTGEKITDEELPTKINKYFARIGATLASKFSHVSNERKQFKPPINEITMEIKPPSQQEIILTLKEMSQHKSSGMKDLSTPFVSCAMDILIKEFEHLYKQVIEQGIFPDDWKIATVTPIPKVSKPKTCNELRPISILPLPGRVLENIINKQMKDFLEEAKYLGDHQYGFRKGRSTTAALAKLLDKLLTARDTGHIAITIFIDFKKAFDTVNHKILLWKLKRAGIGEKTCQLIANYLSDRKQAVKLRNKLSGWEEVRTGVPQGSILGPLLFLIYINDLPLISEIPLYTLFADDAAVTFVGKSIKELEKIVNAFLQDLNTWCDESELTLNANKTEYVIFASKQAKTKAPKIEIKIGTHALNEVDSYKYLGTTLDATLNGSKQLDKLNAHIAYKLTTFRKIRRYMSEKTAILIYKVMILPILDYNDIIYGLLSKQQTTKLQRIQNRALRTVFMGKKLGTQEMHDRAKVDYLAVRRDSHMLALMFDRAGTPDYTDNVDRKTRQADAPLLKVPQPKTSKLKQAPIYRGAIMWNKLPAPARKAKTKLQLKLHIRLMNAGKPLNYALDSENDD